MFSKLFGLFIAVLVIAAIAGTFSAFGREAATLLALVSFGALIVLRAGRREAFRKGLNNDPLTAKRVERAFNAREMLAHLPVTSSTPLTDRLAQAAAEREAWDDYEFETLAQANARQAFTPR